MQNNFELFKRSRKRKHENLGKKLYGNVYFRPEDDQCFELLCLESRYEPYGKLLPPNQWRYRKVGEVYPTGTKLLEHNFLTQGVANRLGIHQFTPATKKIAGRLWKTDSHEQVAEAPVFVHNSGQIEPLAPLRHRTIDQDRRKKFNDQIKKIRQLVRVRAKLGAFDVLDADKLRDTYQDIPRSWDAVRASKFLDTLNNVDENDITTFEMLAAYILQHRNSGYFWYSKHTKLFVPQGMGWVTGFDNLVKQLREKMRHANKIVTYKAE